MAKTRKVLILSDGIHHYECVKNCITYDYYLYKITYDFDNNGFPKTHRKKIATCNGISEVLRCITLVSETAEDDLLARF